MVYFNHPARLYLDCTQFYMVLFKMQIHKIQHLLAFNLRNLFRK